MTIDEQRDRLHTNHGVVVAGDGWVMWWERRRAPRRPDQRIEYFDADGYDRGCTSGTIDEKDLARAIKKFRKEHAGQRRLL